jgi:hypothetical protein
MGRSGSRSSSGRTRASVAIGLAGLLALGCGESERRPAPSATATAGAASTVAIQAAVIRELTAVAPRPKVLYVRDGVIEGAGDPRTLVTAPPGPPFTASAKHELRRALADLPPLRFVRNRDSVVVGRPPGRILGRGLLVTLGPVDRRGDRVLVGANRWASGLNGAWLTFVLERRGSGWRVTGTRGPKAMS